MDSFEGLKGSTFVFDQFISVIQRVECAGKNQLDDILPIVFYPLSIILLYITAHVANFLSCSWFYFAAQSCHLFIVFDIEYYNFTTS